MLKRSVSAIAKREVRQEVDGGVTERCKGMGGVGFYGQKWWGKMNSAAGWSHKVMTETKKKHD